VTYKPTSKSLPVTINLNEKLGFHGKQIRIECFGIDKTEKNIEVAVKINKDSLTRILNQ